MLHVDGYSVWQLFRETPSSQIYTGTRQADGLRVILKLYRGRIAERGLRAKREFEHLQRIQHGQERGDALEELARRLDVDELTETVAMLKQAARYGGNLRESLMRYVKMMEERRMTSLRDKVGKMSAKLSIVMMLFMFPALLLFLAGPGFMALINAFKRMS